MKRAPSKEGAFLLMAFDTKQISHYPIEIIATDEVGRGPLSGPVVIGAIRIFIENEKSLKSFLRTLRPLGVTDSKKLTAKQRHEILHSLGITDLHFRMKKSFFVKGLNVEYVIWEMNHEIIDQENILAASLRGMKEACLELSTFKNENTLVLIDGNKSFRWTEERPHWIERPIIQGDSKSLLIALASIIAKEKRDHFMGEMHALYPLYGFDSHSGYPTKKHLEAIKSFGPSPIHRKTFKGVKEFV